MVGIFSTQPYKGLDRLVVVEIKDLGEALIGLLHEDRFAQVLCRAHILHKKTQAQAGNQESDTDWSSTRIHEEPTVILLHLNHPASDRTSRRSTYPDRVASSSYSISRPSRTTISGKKRISERVV